jgi:hypothetical protein
VYLKRLIDAAPEKPSCLVLCGACCIGGRGKWTVITNMGFKCRRGNWSIFWGIKIYSEGIMKKNMKH